MAYIVSPFTTFADTDGTPLNNGYVYIGTANLNPVTSPISVYWDEALTQPAAQPLRTLNGFFSRSGTPARVYTAATNFSMVVNNDKGELVYSSLSTPPQISQADVDAGLALKLNLTGGTMTGPIVLSGPPATALQPTTKNYVDTADALKVNKAGDTMTGKLNMAAAGIGFSDTSTQTTAGVAKTGDTMSGQLTLSGAPTADLHAATKAYADSVVPKKTTIRAWASIDAIPLTGTYTQTGTIITVQITSSTFHGVLTGMLVNLTFTSGTATSGNYTVTTLVSLTAFQVQAASASTTSGNVTKNAAVLDSYNVSSITDLGIGSFRVSMTTLVDNTKSPSGSIIVGYDQNASGSFVNSSNGFFTPNLNPGVGGTYCDIATALVTGAAASTPRDVSRLYFMLAYND